VIRAAWRFALAPLLLFIGCYFILTFPLVLSFNTAYFCDAGDGPTMVWNVWWVNYAVTHLHQSPWHTNLLYFPDGVTLLLHSMSPINGFFAIPLSTFLPPTQLYNTVITLAFALSGLTAFWLAYDLTRAYWPSMVAGYAFTFSALHFAHAAGHLHQITTQFVPLFVWFWLRFLRKPTIFWAILASATLFLVLLSDHYLFLFCVMGGAIMSLWMFMKYPRQFFNPPAIGSILAFIILSLATSGVLSAHMFLVTHQEMNGLHDPQSNSADLTNLFVPGWTWAFHSLTKPMWAQNPSYPEGSVSIGVAVLAAAIYACFNRTRLRFTSITMLAAIAIIFSLFALGPTLRIKDTPITNWTPYRFLELLFPPLTMGGCPARMMVITQLCCSLLAAAGLKALSVHLTRARIGLIALFVIGLVLESEPRYQPSFERSVPSWAEFVRDAPHRGAIIDLLSQNDSLRMFYQTAHHRPIPSGYISRVPLLARQGSDLVVARLATKQYQELAQSGFIFIVDRADRQLLPLQVAYHDSVARVYRLDTVDQTQR
jgi:hypothetical protein